MNRSCPCATPPPPPHRPRHHQRRARQVTQEMRDESDRLGRERAAKVKEAMQHAWKGYQDFAWGADELAPRGKKPKQSWGGMGVTLVDSLGERFMFFRFFGCGADFSCQEGPDFFLCSLAVCCVATRCCFCDTCVVRVRRFSSGRSSCDGVCESVSIVFVCVEVGRGSCPIVWFVQRFGYITPRFGVFCTPICSFSARALPPSFRFNSFFPRWLRRL